MATKKDDQPEVKWPNQEPVRDGVTPVAEVNQDPDAFESDDLEMEMED